MALADAFGPQVIKMLTKSVRYGHGIIIYLFRLSAVFLFKFE
jgi:hypothetical protein